MHFTIKFNTANSLLNKFSCTIRKISYVNNYPYEAPINYSGYDGPKIRAIILGSTWPENKASAAGVRSYDLVELFKKSGWKLTYISPAKENKESKKLASTHNIDVIRCPANDASFENKLSELNPNMVIYDRFVTEEQFGWRVRRVCPNAASVIDTQDLHFMRHGREAALNDGKSLEEVLHTRPRPPSYEMCREVSAIWRADHAFVVSNSERDLLINDYGIPPHKVSVHPYFYDPHPAASELPTFDEREHFVMLGNFRHPPNADQLKWLSDYIWPKIRQELPEVEVHVYGANPDRKSMNRTEKDMGFFVKGFTSDQFAKMKKYRVNLAPLRFGSGLKGKIADGFWVGTPVVTTCIGAEGMVPDGDAVTPASESLEWGGLIANNVDDFAKAAVRLYQDQVLWKRAQANGFQVMDKLYNKEKNFQVLKEKLLEIVDNRKKWRDSNLMGELLWYHGNRSTEYFSRWLETKHQLTELQKLHPQPQKPGQTQTF